MFGVEPLARRVEKGIQFWVLKIEWIWDLVAFRMGLCWGVFGSLGMWVFGSLGFGVFGLWVIVLRFEGLSFGIRRFP